MHIRYGMGSIAFGQHPLRWLLGYMVLASHRIGASTEGQLDDSSKSLGSGASLADAIATCAEVSAIQGDALLDRADPCIQAVLDGQGPLTRTQQAPVPIQVTPSPQTKPPVPAPSPQPSKAPKPSKKPKPTPTPLATTSQLTSTSPNPSTGPPSPVVPLAVQISNSAGPGYVLQQQVYGINSNASVQFCNDTLLIVPLGAQDSIMVGSVIFGVLETLQSSGPSPCTLILRTVTGISATSQYVSIETLPATLEDIFSTVDITISDITSNALVVGLSNDASPAADASLFNQSAIDFPDITTNASTFAKVSSHKVASLLADRGSANTRKTIDPIRKSFEQEAPKFQIGLDYGGLSLTAATATVLVQEGSFTPIFSVSLKRQAGDAFVSPTLTIGGSTSLAFTAAGNSVNAEYKGKLFEKDFGEVLFYVPVGPFPLPFSLATGVAINLDSTFESEYPTPVHFALSFSASPTLTLGLNCQNSGSCAPFASGSLGDVAVKATPLEDPACTGDFKLGLGPALEVTLNAGSREAYETLANVIPGFNADAGELLKAEVGCSLAADIQNAVPADAETCPCLNNVAQASIVAQSVLACEAEIALGARFEPFTASETVPIGSPIKDPFLTECRSNVPAGCTLPSCGSTTPPQVSTPPSSPGVLPAGFQLPTGKCQIPGYEQYPAFSPYVCLYGVVAVYDVCSGKTQSSWNGGQPYICVIVWSCTGNIRPAPYSAQEPENPTCPGNNGINGTPSVFQGCAPSLDPEPGYGLENPCAIQPEIPQYLADTTGCGNTGAALGSIGERQNPQYRVCITGEIGAVDFAELTCKGCHAVGECDNIPNCGLVYP
ncbi:hypothetical protein COCOBI_02-8400 [Coccomyxa sp. Obi]|nr:hypothetical protein COCOBI_02-8400 [Coccomyxa sp. Obi]